MGVYPTGYNKLEFIEFLKKNNVEDSIIKKFMQLPETITHKKHVYRLNIVSTWYSIGDTYYNFEMNYYSDDIIEFLFTYKIFTNVEESINNLLCDLVSGKYIDKIHECK
jgi:hypothetical protein